MKPRRPPVGQRSRLTVVDAVTIKKWGFMDKKGKWVAMALLTLILLHWFFFEFFSFFPLRPRCPAKIQRLSFIN